MSTSSTAGPHKAAATSIRRGPRGGGSRACSSPRAAVQRLGLWGRLLPRHSNTERDHSTQHPCSVGRSSVPGSTISAFVPTSRSKGRLDVGANERLLEDVIKNSSYECIFEPTTASGWEVIISMTRRCVRRSRHTQSGRGVALRSIAEGREGPFHGAPVPRPHSVQLDLHETGKRGPARRCREQHQDDQLRCSHGPRGEDLRFRGGTRARPRTPAKAGHGRLKRLRCQRCLLAGVGMARLSSIALQPGRDAHHLINRADVERSPGIPQHPVERRKRTTPGASVAILLAERV